MRKLMVLLGLVALTSLTTVRMQAQDTTQPPILALSGNKLWAVSPVDGSATVLVEPPEGQTFYVQRYMRMSPDGKHLVYATQNDPESMTGYAISLFILDLTSGKSEVFQPDGGIFDVKPSKGRLFQMGYPTWSVDGQRLYYVRTLADAVVYGKLAEAQLAYYDMQTRTHKLVARLDPKKHIQDLMSVESGVIVHYFGALGGEQPVVLYGTDHRKMSEHAIENLYPYTVRFEGQDYYATGAPYGGIANIFDLKTGERRFLGDGYYPAMRSRSGGDQSLMVVRTTNVDAWYRIFRPDGSRIEKIIEEAHGVRNSVSPDGQSVAVLQLDINQRSPIQIIEANGDERELPFIAEEIWWSAPEYVAFYEEPKG